MEPMPDTIPYCHTCAKENVPAPPAVCWECVRADNREVAALRAERDAAIISEGCAIADREKAEAERDAMRPVVEAACELRDTWMANPSHSHYKRQAASVDAYREGSYMTAAKLRDPLGTHFNHRVVCPKARPRPKD